MTPAWPASEPVEGTKRGRVALVLLGALMAAVGLLWGSRELPHRPPAVSDWTDWDGTVVFLGDSITDFCQLDRYYPGLNAVNQGISGDTTGGMLERVDADVCAREPQAVVFLGGINDIFMGVEDEAIVSNIRAIVDRIHAALPDTQIIVQSVYPVEEFGSLALTGHVQAVNERLRAQAKEGGYAYADVYSVLAGSDGRLTHGLADDGLHPNDAGYTAAQPVVAQAIKEAIARWERSQ